MEEISSFQLKFSVSTTPQLKFICMIPSRTLFNSIKTRKMVEWLAVVYDKPNTDRSNVRAQHLADIPAGVKNGVITSAGAIFNEVPKEGSKPNFAGSVLTVIADSKEEALEFLKGDIYAREGIWDLENVLIYPAGLAYRKAKDL